MVSAIVSWAIIEGFSIGGVSTWSVCLARLFFTSKSARGFESRITSAMMQKELPRFMFLRIMVFEFLRVVSMKFFVSSFSFLSLSLSFSSNGELTAFILTEIFRPIMGGHCFILQRRMKLSSTARTLSTNMLP